MMLDWQILDLYARVQGGCYSITLAHADDERGKAYIARFSPDPRETPKLVNPYGESCSADYSFVRYRGIGSSPDLESVKAMCEHDAHLFGKLVVS